MNNRPSIIAGFLSLCFTAIIIYVLFAVLSLADKSGGTARVIFAIINCLVLVALATQYQAITRLTSFHTMVQLCCVTTLYTVFQLGAVFIAIESWYGTTYTLYQMIVLFVYLCIALPVLNISYKKNNNKNST